MRNLYIHTRPSSIFHEVSARLGNDFLYSDVQLSPLSYPSVLPLRTSNRALIAHSLRLFFVLAMLSFAEYYCPSAQLSFLWRWTVSAMIRRQRSGWALITLAFCYCFIITGSMTFASAVAEIHSFQPSVARQQWCCRCLGDVRPSFIRGILFI